MDDLHYKDEQLRYSAYNHFIHVGKNFKSKSGALIVQNQNNGLKNFLQWSKSKKH